MIEREPRIDRSSVSYLPFARAPRGPLHGDDGGGTSGGMDDRVARLETHFEYVRRDLDKIGSQLDRIGERLEQVPTKSDLSTWQWQWIATGVAIIALTVGGITGGLTLIAG